MIQEGCVTYPNANSAFRNWQPDNAFQYQFFVAVLTTCLVYQLTRICMDIALGWKKRGEIRISELYMFMLASMLSVKATLSSFGCKGYFARKRYHGKGPSCPSDTSCERKISRRLKVKFIALLLAAPVIHAVGIYLSVERDRTLSFEETGLGGLALGVSNKATAYQETSSVYCASICTKYARGETALAQFFRCYTHGRLPHDNWDKIKRGTFVLALRSHSRDLGFTLFTPGQRWISILYLDMFTMGTAYRLRNEITHKRAKELFNAGVRRMMVNCPGGTRTDRNVTEFIPHISGQQVIAEEVACENQTFEHLQTVADSLLRNLSVISTKELEVSKYENELRYAEFTSGAQLDVLSRRGSAMTFLELFIAVIVVFSVRLVLGVLFNNDAHLAVEAVVKERLGMKSFDSMLQEEKKIHYEQIIRCQDEELIESCGEKLSDSLSDTTSTEEVSI